MENTKKELIGSFTISTPDGLLRRVNVYEGENIKDKLNNFMENWYAVTSKDPKRFGYEVIDTKERVCPKCGGELYYKQRGSGKHVWCIKCHSTFYER